MPRPALSPRLIAVLVSAYVMLVLNASMLHIGAAVFPAGSANAAKLAVALFLAYAALLTALSFPWLFKPMATFFILVAAISAYFMDTFGTIIDRDMITNAVTTTANESRHLLTPALALHMLIYAILPVALVWWVRERRTRFLRDAAINTAWIVVMAGAILVILASDYGSYASVFRERDDLVFSINPGGPIGAAIKFAIRSQKERNISAKPIGTDAHAGPALAKAIQPVFLVIVAGETLRAQNFGLDGYERDTTPELARRKVINLGPATSCGTATATSLPCMFSRFAREDFTSRNALDHENLLDILTRTGFHVEWWDNNTGDKDVARRLPSVNLSRTSDDRHCDDGECRDTIFLDRLRDAMDKATGNTVIVLHQIGSHGPAYFKRYPADFERFKPGCHSVQFGDCTPQEIVNAYDNTVAFTDHVLASIIDLQAASSDRLSTGMIFASDHGESLGEGGLYLHGAPYMFAPETQTKVPFLPWFSDSVIKHLGLSTQCLATLRKEKTSHDNLFHSVLGVLDIETKERNPSLDIFRACRAVVPLTTGVKPG